MLESIPHAHNLEICVHPMSTLLGMYDKAIKSHASSRVIVLRVGKEVRSKKKLSENGFT